MRPDKPGHWWYKRATAFLDPMDCVKIISLAGGVLYVLDYDEQMTIRQFEERKHIRFKRWLGQAYPPKRVQRYELTYSGLELSDEYDDTVDWVRYDDVKEYLLKEDENETE